MPMKGDDANDINNMNEEQHKELQEERKGQPINLINDKNKNKNKNK